MSGRPRFGVHSGVHRALLAGAGLLAAAHPRLAPTRDVAVVYHVQPATAAAPKEPDLRIVMTAGAAELRMDTPGQKGFLSTDRVHHVTLIVDDADHSYVHIPGDGPLAPSYLLKPAMRFTRERTDRVAGLPCTVWGVAPGAPGAAACVTADGVILRADGGQGRGKLTAVSVIYARQPSVLFRPPPGYKDNTAPAP